MKKIFISFIILITCFYGFSNDFKINENCYFYKLENGLTLFVAENHSVPLAYIEIAVKAGGITQNKKNAGLFHLYEHMMFKGNKKYSNSGKVQKALSDMGCASWNGTTGVEHVNYYFTIPSSELENGLDFWNNAIRFPLLDKAELESEKKVVLSEIQGQISDPSRYIGSYINNHLFDKPWQLDPSGSVENVLNASVEQLKEIKDKFYIPQNAALFVGGDVEHEQVYELVKKIYGDWSNNSVTIEQIEQTVEIQNASPFDKPYYCVVPYEKIDPRFTQVVVYYRGPDSDLDLEATYPADLFSYYLDNPESDFVKDFVGDKKLCIPSEQYISSGYSTRRRTGLTAFSAFLLCPQEKVCDTSMYFYQKINDKIESYSKDKNIVPADKRKKIIQRLKDDKVFESETFMGMLNVLRYNWITNSVDYYLTYEKNVEKASNKDIQKYLKKYLVNKNPMIMVFVNPEVYEMQKTEFEKNGFITLSAEDAFWWKK